MSSRAISRAGTGGITALAITQIGTDITLPADGPWTIYGIYGQVAKVTTIPDQGSGGDLILTALSGDLEPNPAPARFPLIGNCANASANDSLGIMPLNIFPVLWEASGKATLKLEYRQALAITTPSRVRAGLLFGKSVPEMKPIRFCEVIRGAFASATEQSLGTIVLAEKATRITGIMATVNHGEAITVGEAVIGSVRIASSDVLLPPNDYPFNICIDGADGTPVGGQSMPQSQFIPLDIEITGGAIIDFFATTDVSITSNAEVSVYIAYE